MNLIDPKVLDRIGSYALYSRTVVEGFISGLHRSMFHGFGSEFVQYRNYVVGDDLKYVDWKVYARTKKLCTKVFREETNMSCRIVLDCSASMSYKGENSEYSKLEIFGKMKDLKAEGSGSHRQCLNKIAEGFKGRGLVIFISDMMEQEEEIIRFLKSSRFAHNDCILMQILDNDEIEFPFSKNVRFIDLENQQEITTAPELVREHYKTNLSSHLEKIRTSCLTNQVDYSLLNTSEDLEHILAVYLHKRGELR